MAQYLDPECVDEVMECPLCMDPLDLTEKCFKPCPCGYQVRPSKPFCSLTFYNEPLASLLGAFTPEDGIRRANDPCLLVFSFVEVIAPPLLLFGLLLLVSHRRMTNTTLLLLDVLILFP